MMYFLYTAYHAIIHIYRNAHVCMCAHARVCMYARVCMHVMRETINNLLRSGGAGNGYLLKKAVRIHNLPAAHTAVLWQIYERYEGNV